jgi:hypothetical protein
MDEFRSPAGFVMLITSGSGIVKVDPFRIEWSTDFCWQVPEELRDRIELVGRQIGSEAEIGLRELFERAMNDPTVEVRLQQLVTPGDRVALAFDPSTPMVLPLLELLLGELKQQNASLEELCIVLPANGKDVAAAIRAWTESSDAFRDVKIVLHDQNDRSAIAYLAANVEGEPIYVAKALADADVAIPVFSSSGGGKPRAGSTARFLYRNFAGAEPSETADKVTHAKRKPTRESTSSTKERDAEEAFWQLGILYALVVTPGVGGSAARIVGGSPAQLDAAIAEAAGQWKVERVAPAGLVIAELSGGVDQQNWQAAARALRNAAQLAAPEGIIVLLSDVSEGQIRKAASAKSRSSKFANRMEIDPGAVEFISALEEVRSASGIFLRSQLSEEVTEDLGMGFISKPAELNRLIERQPRTILVRDAQHVLLRSLQSAPSSLSQ